MELNKELWSNKKEFLNYLETYKNIEKIEWTKNILNTNMEVLAIKANELKKISKEILKGNYLSFLDLNIYDNYEASYINGTIIYNIKDFKTMKKYLDIYSKKIDNWSNCDLLKFKVLNKEKEYFDLSKEYIKSEYIFQRRIGVIILFRLIDYPKEIFEILETLKDEKEYYVNMAISWLLCELYIKRKEETIKYLKTNNLNDFVLNKFVSKCRDSYRISNEEKEKLLEYKR